MISITYPKEYQTEESRKGKKFKFYKVEPYEIQPEKKEKPKEINIGNGSGRIKYISSNRDLKEDILANSYMDLIEEFLDFGSDNNIN